MAYRIEYAPSGKVLKDKKQTIKRLLFAVGFISLTAGVLHGAGLGDVIRDFLIPGNPEVTVAAWNAMVEAIKEGSGLGEAASVFCRQVLEGARFEG